MKHLTTLITFLSITQLSPASDFEIPDPITYEWTVKETQRALPVVDITNSPIKSIIRYISDPSVRPIRLKHNIPDAVTAQTVTWKFKDIKWIDLVAKIADATNSEIRIEKGTVRLVYQKKRAQ